MIKYHVKVREIHTNDWKLYVKSEDLAEANAFMDEAFNLPRYDAIQINEIKTTFICRKEKTE
jgi:hypothetical protein